MIVERRNLNVKPPVERLVDGLKFCTRCGQEKALDYFTKNSRSGDGRHAWCRTCLAEYAKARRPLKRSPAPPLGYARCSGCKAIKLLAQFFRNAARPTGRSQYCKACHHSNPTNIKATIKYRASAKAMESRRTYSRAYQRQYRLNPIVKWKNKVRQLTYLAMDLGVLIPHPCEGCGTTNVQAHHDDYSKPLDVRWLCLTHHAAHHKTQEATS